MIKKLFTDELWKGSLILLVLINLGNIINYLYQFMMARMLGPSDFGVLAVLVSLTYLFGIPTIAIQTVISKNVAKLNVNKEYGKMRGMFSYFLRKLFLTSIIAFILFVIASIFLKDSLGIPFGLLILTGTLLITSFIYPIAAGILQGLKKFSALGWNVILVFSVKLILAVLLVLAGFRVYGAILGFVFGMVVGFIFALPAIKEVLYASERTEKIKILNRDNLITFIVMLIIVLIYSFDVILAKLFFSSEITGQYAVASLIGKIILFSTMSIGNAMFPISAERHHAGEKTGSLIKKASLATIILCLVAIVLLWFFPELIVGILFGKEYIGISNLLIYMGVAFSFISFLNLLILYRISRDEFSMGHIGLLVGFFVLQMTLMTVFNSTILMFSKVFMFSTIITFIGAFVLIRKWKR